MGNGVLLSRLVQKSAIYHAQLSDSAGSRWFYGTVHIFYEITEMVSEPAAGNDFLKQN